MNETDNKNLDKLLIKCLEDNDFEIPNDLSEELKDSLINAVFICPVEDELIIPYSISRIKHFLPVFTNMEDFKNEYEKSKYKLLNFKELSKHLKFFMNGIIINPSRLSFVITKNLVNMLFYKIKDDEKPPVKYGYDVKVRFKYFRPITWKDLIIPENMTFMELDDVLKTIWDFNGSHMSAFIIENEHELIMDGDLSRETMMDAKYNSNFVEVSDFFDDTDKIRYWYDFTDDWFFDIEIKKKIKYDKKYVTIKRFKGEYNPIDDCGGSGIFSDIVESAEDDSSDTVPFQDELYLFNQDFCQELLEKKDYVYSTWYESPI